MFNLRGNIRLTVRKLCIQKTSQTTGGVIMKIFVGVLAAALIGVPAFAQKTAAERLQAATEDLHEIMNAGDKGIPQDLLSKASCVVVIPNLKKGGFIVGGEYGK